MVIFGPKYRILTKVLIGLDLVTYLYSMTKLKMTQISDGKLRVMFPRKDY